jgi:hypothetical protein
MGKSEGNMIAFTDAPEDVFGKVMRWTDGMITAGFELCTRTSMEEIKAMATAMKKGENPRDFKLRLAYEITKTFLGEKAAEAGKAHFASVIQDKEKPTDIPELKPSKYDIVTVFFESTCFPSELISFLRSPDDVVDHLHRGVSSSFVFCCNYTMTRVFDIYFDVIYSRNFLDSFSSFPYYFSDLLWSYYK